MLEAKFRDDPLRVMFSSATTFISFNRDTPKNKKFALIFRQLFERWPASDCFYYCWHWGCRSCNSGLANPKCNYMFKVKKRNSWTRCEICSKLTIRTPEGRHGVVLVSLLLTFKHTSHLVLVFLLLTLRG